MSDPLVYDDGEYYSAGRLSESPCVVLCVSPDLISLQSGCRHVQTGLLISQSASSGGSHLLTVKAKTKHKQILHLCVLAERQCLSHFIHLAWVHCLPLPRPLAPGSLDSGPSPGIQSLASTWEESVSGARDP